MIDVIVEKVVEGGQDPVELEAHLTSSSIPWEIRISIGVLDESNSVGINLSLEQARQFCANVLALCDKADDTEGSERLNLLAYLPRR